MIKRTHGGGLYGRNLPQALIIKTGSMLERFYMCTTILHIKQLSRLLKYVFCGDGPKAI